MRNTAQSLTIQPADQCCSIFVDGNKTADGVKMLEVTRDKQIVWSYHNPDVTWVHTLQVLSTNGEPE